jgi:S-adenosylmethionine synthetase
MLQMARRYVFTSESVTEGHPDKICDQVSDAVLDALLAQDPASRVACETVVNTGLCLITGEVTTTARVDFNTLVRGVIERIGYSGARPTAWHVAWLKCATTAPWATCCPTARPR